MIKIVIGHWREDNKSEAREKERERGGRKRLKVRRAEVKDDSINKCQVGESRGLKQMTNQMCVCVIC